MLILDKPKLAYMPSFINALREGFHMGAQPPKTEDDILKIETDPERFIADCAKPQSVHYTGSDNKIWERVPQEDWWYIDGHTFIGRITAKHYLNEHLLNDAGHIGYSVRPSEHGKGHATAMLNLALDYYRTHHDMKELLLTCEVGNIASEKVIIRCGGIFEDVRIRSYDNRKFKRYWITL